jgi:hypothetical protein
MLMTPKQIVPLWWLIICPGCYVRLRHLQFVIGGVGFPEPVTGSGFLPIAGADLVKVGRKRVFARCSGTTRCTVTLPPLPAGTVNIRMILEDITESP